MFYVCLSVCCSMSVCPSVVLCLSVCCSMSVCLSVCCSSPVGKPCVHRPTVITKPKCDAFGRRNNQKPGVRRGLTSWVICRKCCRSRLSLSFPETSAALLWLASCLTTAEKQNKSQNKTQVRYIRRNIYKYIYPSKHAIVSLSILSCTAYRTKIN